MMAISAQKIKLMLHRTWRGSYFDPKLKLNGIKLNISNWEDQHQIRYGTLKLQVYI